MKASIESKAKAKAAAGSPRDGSAQTNTKQKINVSETQGPQLPHKSWNNVRGSSASGTLCRSCDVFSKPLAAMPFMSPCG